MSVVDYLGLLQQGGPWLVLVGLVLVVLVAGRRGVWVWGREVDRERQRADKYEGLYEGTRALLQKALDASEDQVRTLQSGMELLERMQRRESAPP